MNPEDAFAGQTGQPPAPLSAGQMLRAAREAQGVHLAVLSVTLKVSVRQLEALEADRYEAFKGATFVRALAQSVCRQLRIDAAPVLAALPRNAVPQALEPVTLASRKTHAARAVSRSSGAGKGLSRQVVLLAALMLVGAAALIWWPNPEAEPSTEEVQEPMPPAVPMGQASDPADAVEVVAPAEPPSSALAPVVVSPTPAMPRPAADVVVAKPPAGSPAPAASSAAGVSPSSAGHLPFVLKLTTEAWVEVRDGQGQMVIKRMVKAGETVQLDARAPLFVYVSRADGAELSWQGKTMDLKPYTQNNEARLQIKP